jgi:hypothetical protein
MSTRPNKSTRELSAAGTTFPGAFRVIPTHGGPHPSDLDPTWYGDSIGHWEGDTLVVDNHPSVFEKPWLGDSAGILFGLG